MEQWIREMSSRGAMLGGAASIVMSIGCGRMGFESVDRTGTNIDGAVIGGAVGDGGTGSGGNGDAWMMADASIDAPPPMIACADVNLGSAVGPNVASGSVAAAGNQYMGCSGDGNDVTFGWFAPAAGSYRIDLCNSQMSWDSVLSVRDASCTGASLACDDDSCGGAAGLQGRVTVDLAAGQGVVFIVDSLFPQNGNYQLAITQL